MNDLDKIILEQLNETYFKVHCSYEQALELHSFFECAAENYWFSPKFKAGMWNGKISFYDMNESTIPIGLFKFFKLFIKRFNYEVFYALDKESLSNNISDEEFSDFYSVIFKDSKYYPRDYQDASIKKALKYKRGIIDSATGSGKSLTIYTLIRYMMATTKGKIVLVVPNIDLTIQMFKDFKDYGWTDASDHVSILYGTSKMYDKSKRILISTWQSIHTKQQKFFEPYVGFILDETHSAGSSSSIQSVLKKCVNCEYRFGLTGTMPDSLLDKYNIHGYIGPKLIEVGTQELIQKGYLSDIKIGNIFLQYPKDDIELVKRGKYQDEVEFVIKHKNRNKIFKYIISHINTNDNVLILCERIEHLDAIYDYLVKECVSSNRDIFKIHGNVDPKQRETIRECLESEDVSRKIKMTFCGKCLYFNKNDKIKLTNGNIKMAKDITTFDDIDDVFLEKYL